MVCKRFERLWACFTTYRPRCKALVEGCGTRPLVRFHLAAGVRGALKFIRTVLCRCPPGVRRPGGRRATRTQRAGRDNARTPELTTGRGARAVLQLAKASTTEGKPVDTL